MKAFYFLLTTAFYKCVQTLKLRKIEKVYEWSKSCKWTELCYRPLAENLIRDHCFPRMDSKKECLSTCMYKFYEVNIYHGKTFIVKHFFFFAENMPKLNWIYRRVVTDMLVRVPFLRKRLLVLDYKETVLKYSPLLTRAWRQMGKVHIQHSITLLEGTLGKRQLLSSRKSQKLIKPKLQKLKQLFKKKQKKKTTKC